MVSAVLDRLTFEAGQLLWLVGIGGCAVLVAAGQWHRRGRLRQWATATGAPEAKAVERRGRWPILVRLFALACIVFALADPRFIEGQVPVRGSRVQVVFLLDRSRSMAAQDVRPSRLDLSRRLIGSAIEAAAGQAIALTSFAGAASIDVPLTRDYRRLREELETVGPARNRLLGSNLQAGLSEALRALAEQIDSPKWVVVVTDGETGPGQLDPATIDWPPQTELLVIGVGDPANGGRIPVPADTSDGGDSTRYLTYRGETVVTKPDPDRLRRIATGFGGRLDWLRSASDIPDLLATLDASVDEAAETQLRRAAPPRFQWFLAAALVLVVIELFRGDRASGDRWTELPTDKTAERLTRRRATLGALLLFVSGSCAPDESFGFVAVDSSITGMTERQIAERYNLGVSAYRAGRLDEAGDHFSRVVEAGWGELRRHALFNLANTFAASREHGPIPKTDAIRRLRRAIALYRRCIATGVRPEDARANLEIVYRRLQRIRRLDPETRQRDSGPPEQEPSSGRDESERGRGGHANATRRPRRGEAGGDRSGNSPTAKPGDPPPDGGRAETSGNEPRSERGATETRPLTDEQAERLLQRIHRRAADAGRTGSGRGDDTPEGVAPGLRPW